MFFRLPGGFFVNMKQTNNKTNIILFGPPGVGKSTVGLVFRDKFGFTFYDGDDGMTPAEREKVSQGNWTDADREVLLTRLGETINRLSNDSKIGVVTSVALTRQWMRDFLNNKCGESLHFVLVSTKLTNTELEQLIATRREKEGHAITIESFRKFTAAFETPIMTYLRLENPHDRSKDEELVQNVRHVIDSLGK